MCRSRTAGNQPLHLTTLHLTTLHLTTLHLTTLHLTTLHLTTLHLTTLHLTTLHWSVVPSERQAGPRPEGSTLRGRHGKSRFPRRIGAESPWGPRDLETVASPKQGTFAAAAYLVL